MSRPIKLIRPGVYSNFLVFLMPNRLKSNLIPYHINHGWTIFFSQKSIKLVVGYLIHFHNY